jgi:hypothetical protein
LAALLFSVHCVPSVAGFNVFSLYRSSTVLSPTMIRSARISSGLLRLA